MAERWGGVVSPAGAESRGSPVFGRFYMLRAGFSLTLRVSADWSVS